MEQHDADGRGKAQQVELRYPPAPDM